MRLLFIGLDLSMTVSSRHWAHVLFLLCCLKIGKGIVKKKKRIHSPLCLHKIDILKTHHFGWLFKLCHYFSTNQLCLSIEPKQQTMYQCLTAFLWITLFPLTNRFSSIVKRREKKWNIWYMVLWWSPFPVVFLAASRYQISIAKWMKTEPFRS